MIEWAQAGFRTPPTLSSVGRREKTCHPAWSSQAAGGKASDAAIDFRCACR
jgi:hypothetical protein